MTNDDAPTAGPPDSQDRRRPAPMIDLEATEVGSRSSSETNTETSVQSESTGQTETPSQPPWSRSTFAGRPSATATIGAAVVGGLVVLGGFLLVGWLPRPENDTHALTGRLSEVEQRLSELTQHPPPSAPDNAAIAALDGRLAKLEVAVTGLRAPVNDPGLANRIAAIEGEAKSLAEIVSILGRRSDELSTIAREVRQRADVNAAAIAEINQKIARLGASPVEHSEIDALATRMAAIEHSEKTLEAALAKRSAETATDRSVRFAVAAAALRGAVERGEPFAPLLATTKPLIADPKRLAPLEPFAATGVPSVAALARELTALVPALYQAAGTPPREGGILERLTASAEKLVRIRPIAEVPGSDPNAIIARVEIKAMHPDIAGVLAELVKLPPNIRAPADAWIKRAEMRTAAIEASQQIAAEALAALGK